MRRVLLFVALVAGLALAQRGNPRDPCQACNEIIGYAEFWLQRNTNATQQQLLTELQSECQRLGQRDHDQNVTTTCNNVVSTNIATIYTELKGYISPEKICYDIQECKVPKLQEVLRPKRQATPPPLDNCQICDYVIRAAEHHFSPNMTQAQLQQELLMECNYTARHEGPQAAAACAQIVNQNIAKIYADLKAGDYGYQTCVDIGVCTPMSTTGAPKRVKRQATPPPLDNCQICDFIIRAAEQHFDPRMTQQQLQQELLQECTFLGRNEGQQATQQCQNIVNQNIAKIYADVKAGDRSYQTCYDIGVCVPRTSTAAPKRVKRQAGATTTSAPIDTCRVCDLLVNMAEHHLTRNPNYTEPELQTMLIEECNYLGYHDGRQVEDYCLYQVTTNMDKIYAGVKSGEDALQVCYSLGDCASPTGTDAPLPTYTGTFPTRPPRALGRRVRRQAMSTQAMTTQPPLDNCQICDFIIRMAEQHFDPRMTQQQLQQELLQECQGVARHEGAQAGQQCQNIVNQNIAKIYADLKAGDHGYQTCYDIGACTAPPTTGAPVFLHKVVPMNLFKKLHLSNPRV